jgi:hypothetical protein
MRADREYPYEARLRNGNAVLAGLNGADGLSFRFVNSEQPLAPVRTDVRLSFDAAVAVTDAWLSARLFVIRERVAELEAEIERLRAEMEGA